MGARPLSCLPPARYHLLHMPSQTTVRASEKQRGELGIILTVLLLPCNRFVNESPTPPPPPIHRLLDLEFEFHQHRILCAFLYRLEQHCPSMSRHVFCLLPIMQDALHLAFPLAQIPLCPLFYICHFYIKNFNITLTCELIGIFFGRISHLPRLRPAYAKVCCSPLFLKLLLLASLFLKLLLLQP